MSRSVLPTRSTTHDGPADAALSRAEGLRRIEDLLDLGYSIDDVETSGDLLLVTLVNDGYCAVVALDAGDTWHLIKDVLRA